jgi:HEAT repeat protein
MGGETSCLIHVVGAGLPHRTELLLARERRSLPSVSAELSTPGGGQAEPPALTCEGLARALGSKDPLRAYAAAFLAGRCRARSAAADRALTRRLAEALDKGLEPDVAIEAAMSLALRGEVARGRETLRALLDSGDAADDRYKAAFYLAQMGDPSGYGALVATMRGEIPHYRLMALRHAAAFAPYEGRKVGDTTVRVRELLAERLADPEELVRSEVPFYLEELQVPNLRALLQPVAQHDPSPTVRAAAQIVLDRNPPR